MSLVSWTINQSELSISWCDQSEHSSWSPEISCVTQYHLMMQSWTNLARTPIFLLLMWTIRGVSYSKNVPIPEIFFSEIFYPQLVVSCNHLIEPIVEASFFIRIRLTFSDSQFIKENISSTNTCHIDHKVLKPQTDVCRQIHLASTIVSEQLIVTFSGRKPVHYLIISNMIYVKKCLDRIFFFNLRYFIQCFSSYYC